MADPLAVVPLPPSGLVKESRERWAAFWSSPVSAAVDVRADLGRLVRWIRAIDERERAMRAFRRSRVVAGSTGQPVLNPLAAYLRDLDGQISRAEAEFGMTPMARMRLGIAVGQVKLTAEALNRALNERGDDEDEARDATFAAWSPA